jgi:hypothetical protein
VESIRAGALVKVANDGREQDGIVFDTPSPLKVVVAVVDPRRGPLFRTVHPNTLADRIDTGPDDPALRRLLRRTPLATHREARGGGVARRGAAGYARGAAHRTTGK